MFHGLCVFHGLSRRCCCDIKSTSTKATTTCTTRSNIGTSMSVVMTTLRSKNQVQYEAVGGLLTYRRKTHNVANSCVHYCSELRNIYVRRPHKFIQPTNLSCVVIVYKSILS